LESADDYFANMEVFVNGLVMDIAEELRRNDVEEALIDEWEQNIQGNYPLRMIGRRISSLCAQADRKVVLIIDEADKSADSQIFLSFLGMLRDKYLKREMGRDTTFYSVILSGVYDIKNLKSRLRPDEEKKYNSPWNIAVDFEIDLSFSPEEIASMLRAYEEDTHTGMDTAKVSRLIYDYTSGYPYLVSRLCQLADERLTGTEAFPEKQDVWTQEGIVAAELMLRRQSSTLFEDLIKKLTDYPKLKRMVQDILFCGRIYPFERDNYLIDLGVTFGFFKENNGAVAIGNRIFETKLYDLFLSEMVLDDTLGQTQQVERNQFIIDGMLQMKLVMEKFYQYFTEIYADSDQRFIEQQGRKIFLLYLKPIINGTGNYYIEAQTRDARRTDIIIDYRGRQHIIELKLWRGEDYHQRGKQQLFEYLDYYGAETGYLLSFNFNKNKKTGIQEIVFGGKCIVEVVV
ncbi:MAG: ATP-binding protein, partial [Lachnospiraceae bacterium]|nr:ATP-binding protein [Lachnospiraceae bacterium]